MIEEKATEILFNYGILGLWTIVLLVERWKYYTVINNKLDEEIKLKTKLITLLEIKENKI